MDQITSSWSCASTVHSLDCTRGILSTRYRRLERSSRQSWRRYLHTACFAESDCMERSRLSHVFARFWFSAPSRCDARTEQTQCRYTLSRNAWLYSAFCWSRHIRNFESLLPAYRLLCPLTIIFRLFLENSLKNFLGSRLLILNICRVCNKLQKLDSYAPLISFKHCYNIPY